MKKLLTKLYVFAGVLGVGMVVFVAPHTVSSAPNLIANGGFESPLVTHSALWDIFPSGTAGLGWTVEWGSSTPATYGSTSRPSPAYIEVQKNGHLGYLAREGDQFGELDSDWVGPTGPQLSFPSSVKIHQDVVTTPGDQYLLSFAFSPRPDASSTAENILDIEWNTNHLDTITRSNLSGTQTEWQLYTYTLTASASTTRLAFSDGGLPNAVGTHIDDVMLVFASTSTATTTTVVVAPPLEERSGGSGGSRSRSSRSNGEVLGSSVNALICTVSTTPTDTDHVVTFTAVGGDGTFVFDAPETFIFTVTSSSTIEGSFSSLGNNASVLLRSAGSTTVCPSPELYEQTLVAVPTGMPHAGTSGSPYVTYFFVYLGLLAVWELVVRKVKK